ncbi:hypothetical protein ACTG9Q_14830 [Actinokineospora sp. 24-640]
MAVEPGQRLLGFLREHRSTTSWSARVVEEPGAGSLWRLVGSTWRAEVSVRPPRWLGLTFETADPVTDRRIAYEIDTDLYDISREGQRGFAEEVESDIIEFLDNLVKGHALRGQDGANTVLVFPLGGSFVRVVRGRFLTRSSVHAERSAAQAGGAYTPVV